jgi:D-alanyl-D-alanine carboxypeptidase
VKETIKAIQTKLGVKADGIAGPVTWGAIHKAIVGAEKPLPTKWPRWDNRAELEAFYTPVKLVKIVPPYPLRIFIGGKWVTFKTLTCHAKVAASLSRILAAIKVHYGGDMAKIKADGMDVCEGVYVDRPVTGGKRKSMHAYGAAIDFNAEGNPLGSPKNKMPKAVIAIFKAEGWRWGGDYTGRKDPMHLEACS